MLVIILLLAFGAFIWWVAVSTATAETAQRQAIARAIADNPGFVATHKGISATSGIAVDEQSGQALLLGANGTEVTTRRVALKDILSCEVLENRVFVTEPNRSHSGLETKSEIKSIAIRLTIDDPSQPVFVMECWGDEHISGVQQAREWNARMQVLLNREGSTRSN